MELAGNSLNVPYRINVYSPSLHFIFIFLAIRFSISAIFVFVLIPEALNIMYDMVVSQNEGTPT